MDLRENKSRLVLLVAALGAALVIGVASCSGGGDDSGTDASQESQTSQDDQSGDESAEPSDDEESQDGDGDEVLAEVTGERDITLTITRAERESGGFLTVEGTLYNGGSEGWRATAWAGEERELAVNGFSMAGATLTAHEEGKRYLILRDTEGRCLCTNFGLEIAAGDSVNWFAQFPEPDPGTTEVDFQIGQMPPATITIR